MIQPATVKQAAEKAKLQELALEVLFRKHTVQSENYPLIGQHPGGNLNRTANPVKPLTMEQRRQLGLIFQAISAIDNYCKWKDWMKK